jgi:hypothetical protein
VTGGAASRSGPLPASLEEDPALPASPDSTIFRACVLHGWRRRNPFAFTHSGRVPAVTIGYVSEFVTEITVFVGNKPISYINIRNEENDKNNIFDRII